MFFAYYTIIYVYLYIIFTITKQKRQMTVSKNSISLSVVNDMMNLISGVPIKSGKTYQQFQEENRKKVSQWVREEEEEEETEYRQEDERLNFQRA